jgi:hypothetical protein
MNLSKVSPQQRGIGSFPLCSELRYTDALNLYQQAVDNLADNNYEAVNPQLRKALEDLVVRLAREHPGYAGQWKAGEDGQAINHMVDTGRLAARRRRFTASRLTEDDHWFTPCAIGC